MQKFLHSVFFSVLVLCAALCLFNAYIIGKSDGRNSVINYGAFNDLSAMAIAISEGLYGFDEGYVGHPEVMQALGDKLTPDGLMVGGEKNELLARNGAAIEAALQAATSLDSSTFQPYEGPRAPFVVMAGEDTGLVDFYRLAFAIFGYHADATYNCYFLLLALSSLLFLIQARGSLWFAGLLVAVLYGFNTLFYLDSFITPGAPTVCSNRLFGTLGIVATLHIILFLSMQPRYSIVSGWLLLLPQIALLIFVMTVRSSSLWQWLAILAWLALPIIFICWRKYKRRILQRDWRALLHRKWPVVALLALLLTMHHIAQRERLDAHNDIYFSECTMPHHLRWHSAYLAFDMHPKWPQKAPVETGDVLYGDGMGWNVATYYLKRKYPGANYVCKRFPGFVLFGLDDKLMEKAFFKFAAKQPGFIIELYAYYKPRAIFHNLKRSLTLLPGWWWPYAGVGAVLMAAAGLVAGFTRQKIFSPLALASLAIVTLLFLSNMPAMFAYPSYMAETLMLLLAAMAFLPAACAGALGGLLGKALRKAFGKGNPRLPTESV